jgi:bidirectional [NiFe] hydrogenase diaphorase subunit
MSTKIKITIDGKPVEVEKGSYLLAAIESLGIDVPAPCRYPFLPPRPVCKLCSVEAALPGAESKIVESCGFECVEGLVVRTDTPAVLEARKKALSNLVQRCAENDLLKHIATSLNIADQIKFGKELCTCIYCKLCIRVCEELVGANALSFKKGKVKEEEGESTPIVLDQEKCIMCSS